MAGKRSYSVGHLGRTAPDVGIFAFGGKNGIRYLNLTSTSDAIIKKKSVRTDSLGLFENLDKIFSNVVCLYK